MKKSKLCQTSEFDTNLPKDQPNPKVDMIFTGHR